jgi:pimeloyl-ACP methyl ester carboxylesterase
MSGATGVRDGTLAGGLPYLAVGEGTPLVYIPGGTFEHKNPTGLARTIALSTVRPFVRAGFEVHLVNRRPGLPADVTMADVAADYATAIRARFGGDPVDVIGHSTGGSIVLQLIADHPEVVRRAVVASAAYRLGPVAKRAQREMARRARLLLDAGDVRRHRAADAVRPAAHLSGGGARGERPSPVLRRRDRVPP